MVGPEFVCQPPELKLLKPKSVTVVKPAGSFGHVVPGGGGVTTVTAAVPLRPSLVAVIVANPTATPVTNPLPLTVAVPTALLDHVMTRPVSGLPRASLSVAVSCTVCPAATLGVAGFRLTVATGAGGVTVTADEPLCPSLVAVIVTGPAATPVTSPLPLTVAVPRALLDHVMTRPVNTLPLPSLVVAVSCTICPTDTLGVAGLTVTVATGTGVTVSAAVPLFPSLVAVIVTVPVLTPVTSPLPFTVARPVLLLAHVTTRPVSTFPFASRGVAVSCTVCPAITLADAGLTLTVATGTVTVTAAEPLWPSLVAVIVAVPASTPVTTPLPFTVAVPASSLAHVTTRPSSTFPLASRTVAVSCSVCPAITFADAGLTLTDATAAGVSVTVIPAVPFLPSLVAVMIAKPAATGVTSPLPLTVATPVLLLVQLTARPVRTFPLASSSRDRELGRLA